MKLKRKPKVHRSASDAKQLSQRRRMRPGDVISTATLGPRTRVVRAVLSAVGIAIGIAALVAMLGIPASDKASMDKEMEAMGANLIAVYPGQNSQDQSDIPLLETAPAMLERIRPVKAVLTTRTVADTPVYRNDKVPANQTGAVTAGTASGNLLGTLNAKMAQGKWFDKASKSMPTVVLGDSAAKQLGVGVGSRIWIDNRWWAVIGVIEPMKLAQQLDSTAFLAPEYAKKTFPEMKIDAIYVSSLPGKAKQVRQVVGATANPSNPQGVNVSFLSELFDAGEKFNDTLRNMSLGLGAIALLVGGIGIANTMVVAVMERRGEVGLRRAMGARTGQVALQFVLEAAVIGLVGGLIGLCIGSYAVFLYTAFWGKVLAIPVWTLACGPVLSVLIGAMAGLYPSLKAAKLSPTVALKAV